MRAVPDVKNDRGEVVKETLVVFASEGGAAGAGGTVGEK